MLVGDLINGLFEVIGGLLLCRNCVLLYRAKKVAGVSVLTTAFFSAWGYWNLYYYPSLNQWFSFLGGCLIVVANTLWVLMAMYYAKKGTTNE